MVTIETWLPTRTSPFSRRARARMQTEPRLSDYVKIKRKYKQVNVRHDDGANKITSFFVQPQSCDWVKANGAAVARFGSGMM